MAFSNAAQNALMLLIFNATAWANMADNAASSPQAFIAVALHTADPGGSGNMTTSEAAYTNYARVNVARSNVGWTVTTNTAVPAANIDFPAGTGGAGTLTNVSLGRTGGGAAAIHISGTLTPNVVSGNGVTPRLTTATTVTLN